MATEFIATIKSSDGDYTTLAGWEAGVQNDLTSAAVKVFSVSSSSTGSNKLAAGTAVHGGTSGATATVVLLNYAANQIMLTSISGTFSSGENVHKTDDTNKYCVISNAGDSVCAVAECYASAKGSDTSIIDIDGWTTGASNYIKIYAPSGERHAGKWDGNKFYIEINGSYIFYLREQYVRFDGLQISQSYTSAGCIVFYYLGFSSTSNDIHISHCIFKGPGISATNRWRGITSDGDYPQVKIWNTIFYNWSNEADGYLNCTQANVDFRYYSCTIINLGSTTAGVRRENGNVVMKNCYVHCANGNDYTGLGANFTLTTCAGSDTTGDIDSVPYDTTTFENVTVGSEDYHIKSGSLLTNAGTDTSGDSAPLNFTTDIDYTTRSGTWDIGADEYVASFAPMESGYWANRYWI